MNDKIIGYCALLAIILFIFTPAAYVIWKSYAPVEVRTIDFGKINSLSFLTMEDPVRTRGVQVGQVRKIFTRNNHTFVQIECAKPLKIYKGYSISATLKGLLGDRYISIHEGNPTSESIDKNAILIGTFPVGPTEIISLASKLKEIIDRLVLSSNSLVCGTSTQKSFITKFNTFVVKLDTVSSSLVSASENFNKSLDKNKDTIQYLLKETIRISDTLSNDFPKLLNDVQNTIATANKITGKVDQLIMSTDKYVDRLNDPKCILWKEDIKSLRETLSNLQSTVKDLQENGLYLQIKFH